MFVAQIVEWASVSYFTHTSPIRIKFRDFANATSKIWIIEQIVKTAYLGSSMTLLLKNVLALLVVREIFVIKEVLVSLTKKLPLFRAPANSLPQVTNVIILFALIKKT